MGLIKIGRLAVDPETIARIEDTGKQQDSNSVNVCFRDGSNEIYEGQDADSWRAFVAALTDGVKVASGLAPKP